MTSFFSQERCKKCSSSIYILSRAELHSPQPPAYDLALPFLMLLRQTRSHKSLRNSTAGQQGNRSIRVHRLPPPACTHPAACLDLSEWHPHAGQLSSLPQKTAEADPPAPAAGRMQLSQHVAPAMAPQRCPLRFRFPRVVTVIPLTSVTAAAPRWGHDLAAHPLRPES